MIDKKVNSAFNAALNAFATYHPIDTAALAGKFAAVFAASEDFMTKVARLDGVFDDEPVLEPLREVFFDLLMVNFFSADVNRLEEDYLDSREWEQIEEDTLERGTELLNLLLYLTECEDEDIDPDLEDYLKEFLLVDDDEFQDEYAIYEPVIENQILMESPVPEIAKVAAHIPAEAELKYLFYPLMCFFQNPNGTETDKREIEQNAPEKDFDMAVYEILTNFK